MSTDQTQNQQPQQLDPTVVSLTKAIGRAETGGNYEDYSSDNGHSAGAYSWNNPTPMKPGDVPANFKSDASQYGLNPDDFSPANQDEVAYKKISALGSSGLKPAQIASLWNSGNPDAYKTQKPGYNAAQGVNYDTPAYVKRVEQYYSQEMGGLDEDAPESTIRHDNVGGLNDKGAELISKGFPGVLETAGLAGVIGGGAAAIPEVATTLGTAGTIAGLADAGALGGAGATTATTGGLTGGLISQAGKFALGDEALNTVRNLFKGKATPSVTNNTTTTDTAGEQALQNEIEQLSSSIPQSQQASNQVSGAIKSILGQTASGTKDLQDARIQNGVNTIGMYGGLAPSNTDENERLQTIENQDKAYEHIGNISESLAKVMDSENGTVNLDEVGRSAKANYRKFNNNATPLELEQADKNIDNEIESYKRENKGNIVKLGHSERIRKQQGKASGRWDMNNSTKKGAHKSIYGALKEHNFNATEHKELYKRALEEQSALFDAIKVLKKLDGKKPAVKESLVKQGLASLAKYAEIAVGDKIGGPFGAIVGAIIGQKSQQILNKNFGSNVLESKGMKKALEQIKDKNPAVARILEKELHKIELGISKSSPKLLTEGKEGPKSQNFVPIIPPHTTYEKQAQKIGGLVNNSNGLVKKSSVKSKNRTKNSNSKTK